MAFLNLPRFDPFDTILPFPLNLSALLLATIVRVAPPSDFRRILGTLSHRHDLRRTFDGFVRLAACALLGVLPKGWNYGVEIRNKHFLQSEYFAALARHGVAHVFNSWSDMPSVSEQCALSGSLTTLKHAIRKLFLYVNNRLEGNALLTIMAVLDSLDTPQ
jgi:hypothetical protein